MILTLVDFSYCSDVTWKNAGFDSCRQSIDVKYKENERLNIASKKEKSEDSGT